MIESGAEPPLVFIDDVYKEFGTPPAANLVLRGVTLAVPRQSVCVLLGPSGSGKSTLLRCVNELETITGGAIYLNGELLGYRRDGEGRLHRLGPDLCAGPGDYIEFCGLFAPEEGEAPEESFWICTPAREGCRAVRLLCCAHTFLGELEVHAMREVWCCGAPLPLRGAMLVLYSEEDTLCGLPLFLAI